MANFKFFMRIILALLMFHRTYVFAECNVCSFATNQACVSETKFALCTNAAPSLQSYECPSGEVCSTVGGNICQPANDPNTVKACQDCFKCDTTRTFACTGLSSFALCLGNSEYSPLYIGSCAVDAYCNIDNPRICGTYADLVFPTCPQQDPASTTTTTTSAPITPSPTEPSAYCQYIQETGRFPMGSNIATTCHQYIHCYYVNSIWRGASYVCPGNTYYDSSTKICTANVPPRCSTAVRSFSLLDIKLD